MNKLLTRDVFRETCLKRDGYKCVFCKSIENIVVHHVIERRLFQAEHEFGGYFENVGISVCELCHILCEQTNISVEEARAAAGITKIVLPSHLYDDQIYTKWGDVVLADGRRLKGPLFFDESVQKVLEQGNVLDLYSPYTKYPRSMHLPWSEGLTDDDRKLESVETFVGKRVIVTEKMDGENSSLYTDYFHARSIDGKSHPSRAWVKNFWGQICGDIPGGFRVCGENLFAKHSIGYDNLTTYFMGFSIWNEKNICLSWDETLVWFDLLGITPVPVLYDGIWDEVIIRKLYDSKKDWHTREGYVVRLAEEFPYGKFRTSVGKFVRKGHVQTAPHGKGSVGHWTFQEVIPNKLVK
jgi:hypothetical protein